MPRFSPDHVPSYRLHKHSGQAVVTLSAKDYLLGKFGSQQSKVRYHELIARWIAGGRKPLDVTPVCSLNPDTRITLLSRSGRLLAKIGGYTAGNVLLRREQYAHSRLSEMIAALAKLAWPLNPPVDARPVNRKTGTSDAVSAQGASRSVDHRVDHGAGISWQSSARIGMSGVHVERPAYQGLPAVSAASGAISHGLAGSA